MILFVVAFLTGFLTKFTDFIVDSKLKTIKYLEFFTGFIYGFLIAWVIVNYPVIAPLWFGTVLAMIFTKKIDCLAHYFGIGTMLLFLVVWGIPAVNTIYLLIFSIAALLDEIGNDLIYKRKVKGILKIFFDLRLTLELTTFIVSSITGLWILWLALLSFDLGYILTNKIFKRYL